ncbi:hypothetical protein TBLA_0F01890 [Henningerozyma blattae CBS 6284]|uniref:CCHC-type domain-containing protein n=1 Tax=Henningerozyma blattae (strain ATCC 34711 / CBS 6284 / DSM 70876 / NBRC 10599 / NRRL Y-10934 / UCD 77-7) TaxID=1071380 RepID=I2H5S9_HENB6|nr:hypothetical protein TBLA_0F01890 [Tetrapisispora blattae CBS 6284]CCH61731.1 hypothetical protein TBLA_0F01890 [Tetrapisispora blattae CBS 6284]
MSTLSEVEPMDSIDFNKHVTSQIASSFKTNIDDKKTDGGSTSDKIDDKSAIFTDDNKSVALTIEEVDDNKEELRALRGQGRYFGLEDDNLNKLEPKCNNCSQRGHLKKNCPHVICTYCGVLDDHYSQHCPKAIICSNCNESGHYKSKCPQKWKRKFCTMCNSKIHSRDRCPNVWRSYLLKESPENSNNKNDTNTKKQSKLSIDFISCYNCGFSGHFGDDCRERRSSKVPIEDGSAFSGDNLAPSLKKEYYSLLNKVMSKTNNRHKRFDDDHDKKGNNQKNLKKEKRQDKKSQSAKRNYNDSRTNNKKRRRDDYDYDISDDNGYDNHHTGNYGNRNDYKGSNYNDYDRYSNDSEKYRNNNQKYRDYNNQRNNNRNSNRQTSRNNDRNFNRNNNYRNDRHPLDFPRSKSDSSNHISQDMNNSRYGRSSNNDLPKGPNNYKRHNQFKSFRKNQN